MATYSLTGSGVQAITSGSTKLFALVTMFAPTSTIGQANPTNWFGLGLLRFGQDGWFMPTFPIDATQMWIPIPSGATDIGYSLLNGTTLTLSEDVTPPPPGTSVSTDKDSTGYTTGDIVTITWSRSTTPSSTDYVLVVDTGWNIGFGNAFGYVNTANSGYTALGGSGGTPQASGSLSGPSNNPFGATSPVTVQSHYVDGATNSVIADGPTFTFTP